MNKIFFDGFLVADPQKRRTQSGNIVTSARIVHRDKPDDPGVFISIVAWGRDAENLATFHKGDLISFSGRLSLKSWTGRDNVKRTEVEITLEGGAEKSVLPKKEKPKIDGMAYAPQIPGYNAPPIPPGQPHYDAGYDIPGDRG